MKKKKTIFFYRTVIIAITFIAVVAMHLDSNQIQNEYDIRQIYSYSEFKCMFQHRKDDKNCINDVFFNESKRLLDELNG